MPLPDSWIDAAWAWGGSTGAGVKVAIIDTGVEADHPAVGRGIDGYVAFRDAANRDEPECDVAPHGDEAGHGTACAGIVRGVAPECELYSVKVLGAAVTGRASVLAAGIRWAIDNRMDVCNLSLGTMMRSCFPVLRELADEAYFRRVVLVTAANNDGPRCSLPAACAAVISVAAHAVPDPLRFYANPNPPAEFCAWGVDVPIASLDKGRIVRTGNSLAAPHMSGIIARILAKHPDLNVFQLKTVLWQISASSAAA